MGSGKGTQTQQQSYVANPQITAAGTQALNQAQSAAQLPFNLPVAPVAGFNPTQQQAFAQTLSQQGMAQPYYNQAQNLFNMSAAPISASQINQYLNPYAGNVLDQLRSQQGAQMADLTGKATQTAGGIGADRIGVAQGQLANQQSLATGQTLSGIYGQALSAAQQDAQRQQAAAYGIGNLGGAAQNAAMQGTQALLGTGNQAQALTQAQLNAPYQNQVAQAAFPYQQAQYLAGVTGNLAGAFGGTTYGQMTPAPPSMFSQVAGLGTGLAGAYGAYNSLNGSGANGGWYGPSSVGGAPLNSKDGGRIGYDNGGGVGGGVTGDAGWMNADPAIPTMQMHPAQVNHPQLNWNTGKSDNIGSDIGSIAKTAATIAPLFLKRGGGAYSNKFAEGGDSFDDRFDPVYSVDPTRDANFAAGADMLRHGKGQVWGNPTPPAPTRSVAPDIVNAGDPIRMDASGKMMGNMTSNRGQAPVANMLDGPPSTKLVVNPMAGPPDDAAPAPAYVPLSGGAQPKLAALHQSVDDEAGSSPYGGSTGARDAASTNMAAMKDRTYETPYPDVGYGQQSTSRDFARSPWLALMNAGFGMMAGTSPYAGVNIGKGLLAGTQTLEKQREQDREDESVNQRAKQLAMQADQHLDAMTKMTPYQAAQVQQAQNALEQKGWQKGNENAMGDITLWRSTPDGIESGVLHADGRFETRGVAAPSGGLSMDANKPPQPIPPIPAPPGGQAPPPQSAPAPANTAIAPSGSQIVNTPPEQMIAPAQESGAETNPTMLAGYNSKGAAQSARAGTQRERTDIVKATKTADNSQYRLQDMKRDLDTVMSFVNGAGNGSQFLRESMRPGVGSDKVLEAAKIYNKLNPGHGVPQEVLAAAINWSKNATLAGFSGIVGEGLSAREAQPIIRASMNAVASMNMPEAASRALLSGGMQLAQRAKDKQAFFDDYVAHNGGISNGWEAQFEKKHPIGNYIARSVVDSLPPEGRAKLGADTQLLRQRRDEFMKVEKAGGAGAVEARQKYERVKRNFDFRYGGTSNYFAFGSL